MTEMTPEMLQAFADLTESKTLGGYASAWEADLARIEALEKDNQIMAMFIREHMTGGRYYDPGLKRIVDAALTAKEKPCPTE